MIVAYAGVQVDDESTRQPRLPESAVADVEIRVRRLLARLKPRLIIGAAASGSDLIVAGAARREGIPVTLVLPHDVDTFRATSVSSRGDQWVARYERLLDDPAVIVEQHADDPDGNGVYEAHNRRLLDRGTELLNTDEQVWTLVVAPGELDPSAVTADFVARAEERQLLVLTLNPLMTPAKRRKVFVAMPYAVKYDPETHRKLDCDTIFDKVYVPALEDHDLEWERADLQADTGIIHAGMIDSLAQADLVLADLSTGNANVAYELGLRHALAPHVTLVTKPVIATRRHKSRVPFDVAMIRNVQFDRTFDAISDAHAGEAIRALRRTLTRVSNDQGVDSPVFAWFERDDAGRLVQRHERAEEIQRELQLRATVRAAVTSSEADRIREALSDVAAADVAENVVAALRHELAVAAADEKEYGLAVETFALAEPPRTSPLRELWLQQYGLALSRRGHVRADAGLDPTDDWQTSERLLTEARSEFGDSEETCGILGGLVKRRFRRHLGEGQKIEAHAALRRMIDLYAAAFSADPGYYAGVNLVFALRVGIEQLDTIGDWSRQRVADVMTVVRFFADHALTSDPDGFWPLVTRAEIALHSHQLTGSPPVDAVTAAYARAAGVPAAKAWRDSAADQLQLLMLLGDPPELGQPLVELLEGDRS